MQINVLPFFLCIGQKFNGQRFDYNFYFNLCLYKFFATHFSCLLILVLVRANCVPTNVVCALADVVATELGIILPSSFSFHILFSQNGFAYDFEFFPQIVIHGWTAGRVRALWVSEHPLGACIFAWLSE